MSDLRYTEVFQVFRGKVRQDVAVDRVVVEGGFVLLQSQTAQPGGNV
jgi:hypothetical protein